MAAGGNSGASTSTYYRCVEAGAIGGMGAIPGTLAAHPADVVKVRQQVSSEPFLRAVSGVYAGRPGRHRCVSGRRTAAPSSAAPPGAPSLRNFLSGSVPAVQQKVVTRAPMFLASALSSSLFESRLGLDPTSAAFVGSAASGYVTGSLASPWEWQKVLMSQGVSSPAAGRGPGGLLSEAIRAHGTRRGLAAVGRRVHAAGVRNAVFDSTFFGCKRAVEDRLSEACPRHPYLDSGVAYGAAALMAVVVDYAVDVTVKRMYAQGPERDVPRWGVVRSTASVVAAQGTAVFRGLGFKCVEFGVSYVITGLMAAQVAWGVEQVARKVILLEGST